MADRNMTRFTRHRYHTTREGMVMRFPPSDQLVVAELPDVVDPFLESVDQKFPLGTELWYAERKFRYAKAGGTALARSKMMQQTVPLAGHLDEALTTIAAAGGFTVGFTAAADPTDALLINDLADGYLMINQDATTGVADVYRIKSHPAMPGATSILITLYDPLLQAVPAAALGTVLFNKYKNLIVTAAPPSAKVIGVTPIAVTASYYFWIQVAGPCACLLAGTVVIGDFVVPITTAGAVGPSVAVETDGPPVAQVLAVNATTEYGLIDLHIEQ